MSADSKKKHANPIGSWVVRVKCVILKEVICENCTREQAESEPFEHAVEECEVDQMDWEVQRVTSND